MSKLFKFSNNTIIIFSHKFTLLGLLILISACSFNLLAADLVTSKNEQKKQFLAAEAALEKNSLKTYFKHKRALKSGPEYPLYPYLLYRELKNDIKHKNLPKIDTIIKFKKRYSDFPLHQSLLKLWLLETVRQKKIEQFTKYYQPNLDTSLDCEYHYQQYIKTKDKSFLIPTKEIWLSANSQPKACDKLFNAALYEDVITSDLIWQRLVLAFEAENYQLAKYLVKKLPETDKNNANLFYKLMKNPRLINKHNYFTKNLAQNKDINFITQIITKLAKIDASDAQKFYNKHKQQLKTKLTPQNINIIINSIGLYLAIQKSDAAIDWYQSIETKNLNPQSLEWRIRAAILEQHWELVKTWILDSPTEFQADSKWQYWLAKAYEKTKNEKTANEIYTKIAKIRDFYGFIASYKLNIPINLNHNALPKNQTQIKKLAKSLPLLRIRELYSLNRGNLARLEFNEFLNTLSESEQIAAAFIAKQNKWEDLAILATYKIAHKDDLNLRFPLGEKQNIYSIANNKNLDPAWIFAITRQESAFFKNAVSKAGARGLMQLMPKTAKQVAKMEKLTFYPNYKLNDPEYNIQLGTAYLEHLKTIMNDNFILVTASYNAGPNRIKQYLPKNSLEADIWIETLPIKETRNYVKNVITYTSIYQTLMNQKLTLKQIMQPVRGN